MFNAILVRGDAIGDVMFYGRGAGKLPTASAVVADVIDEVKHLHARKYLFWEPGEEGYVLPFGENKSRVMLRFTCADADAAMQQAAALFGEVTRVSPADEAADMVAFVTPRMKETAVDAALEQFTAGTLVSRLRVASL